MAEVVRINACDITDNFETEVTSKIERFWIGPGYPGNAQPQRSYEECYLEILGKIPVLITAPHAVPHDRGEDKLKEEDVNTHLIVMELCKNVNTHGLIALKPLADPNKLSRPTRKANPPVWKDTREVSFFLEAERVIREQKVEFLLDIHGMADSYEDSAVVGTAGVKTKDSLAGELKVLLQQNGVKAAINSTRGLDGTKRNFGGGKFVQNISIPGLQLEISRPYRTRGEIHKLCKMLSTFLQGSFKKKGLSDPA